MDIPLLVLAGGKATRLGDLSKNLPKYLMPVSEHQPFADLHLQWVARQGFKKVYLSVGYLAEQVIEYCQSGSQWNLQIEYVNDGAIPLGTGGAVAKAPRSDILAVTYGDTLLQLDVKDFLQKFTASSALGAMTYYENKVPGHQCNIAPWEDKTSYIRYQKVSPPAHWKYIDYGFLALRKELIQTFPQKVPLDLAEPLSDASAKKQIMGYECSERFWEIGSPQALHEFQAQHKERN